MKISLSAVFLCHIDLCFNFVGGYVFDSDKQCAAQSIPGQSVICVCNASYCDTITRIKPKFGTYVAYTSSEGGLRFRKTFGDILFSFQKPDINAPILELDPLTLYQVISGFGGAVTDSAGIVWKSLEEPRLRQHLVNSYCSKLGLEYNMLRLPIAGSDFSTHPYTYDDFPDDNMLSNFSLASEDKEYKIPLIKACMDVATSPINIVGSMWSPPAWMKTSNSLVGGYLKEDHYQTLANYYIKFLEKYDEFGISLWAVTTSNEPLSAIMLSTINMTRIEWTVAGMGKWIVNNLGPTLRNSTFRYVKILGCDDQRFSIPLWFNVLLEYYPAAIEYLNGLAVHSYYDSVTPASQLTLSLENYPDKFILSTEACAGTYASADERVLLGSWSRAEYYANDILEDLNYNMVGWIDWNMCLNVSGGPNWIRNFVDSPIIVSAEKQEFYKQPMFYAMGHFSKFVPRGSMRFKVTEIGDIVHVQNVAFVTPQNTIVVILFNKSKRRDIAVKLGSQFAIIDLEPKSITTVEFSYKSIPYIRFHY